MLAPKPLRCSEENITLSWTDLCVYTEPGLPSTDNINVKIGYFCTYYLFVFITGIFVQFYSFSYW